MIGAFRHRRILERLFDPVNIILAALWAVFFHTLPWGWKRLAQWKAEAVSFSIDTNDTLRRSFISFMSLLVVAPLVGASLLMILLSPLLPHSLGMTYYLDAMLLAAPLGLGWLLWLIFGIDKLLERLKGVTGHYRLRLGMGSLHRCSECGENLYIGELCTLKDELGRATGYVCPQGHVDRIVRFPLR